LEFVFENDKNHNAADGNLDIITPVDNNFAQSDVNFGRPEKSARRSSRRTLPKNFSDIEFNEPVNKKARKRTTGPKVNYVKSVKKKRKSTKSFEWSWTKLGWMACGALVLRLFFMESGIIDYNSMNNTLEKRESDLLMLRQDNADLIGEIHKIKTSPSYQKKLARDHLGVIAQDEYLILFSKESAISSI
jgi:cell division protein FtsB